VAVVAELWCGVGRISGDIGGDLALHRFRRFYDVMPASGLVPEQAPPAPAAAAGWAGTGVAAGRAAPQVARRVGAGGVALADQVVAVPGELAPL
jgi:hypothetical protein